VTFAPGQVGQAFQFDGTSNVQVPTNATLNAYPLTLTAWLRTSATGPELRGIMSRYQDGSSNGFSLHVVNGNLGAWYLRDGNNYVYPGGLGLDGGAVADGNWHHVAFTVGADGGHLYVDGMLKSSATWIGTPGPARSAEPLLIGRFYNYMPTFDGTIDEAALYSQELSAGDIASLFATGRHGLCGHCVALPANLISWWRGQGDASDFAGANPGTLQGAVAFAPGRVGQGFAVSGTNYVQVPTAASLNSYPLTLTTWLRTTAAGPEMRGVLSKFVDGSSNGFSLHVANSNIYAWYSRDSDVYSYPGGLGLNGGTVADGNWHHVAFTVDESGGQLYVDGALTATQGWAGSPGAPSTIQPLLIGRYDTFTPTFDGMIDEPALYARGLPAAEILSLFASSGHGICVPPSLAVPGVGTNIQLCVIGTTGEAYQLQTAPTLTGPWTNLGPAQVADPAGKADFTDATPASRRFYRAAVVDP